MSSTNYQYKMKKKGQITIFMIAGIIILATIVITLGLQSFIVAEEVKVQTEMAPLLSSSVQNYIESCLEKTGREALIFVGQQGGYYNLPELPQPLFNLPYYLYEESNQIITKKELEEQLSAYVDQELIFCLQNFVPLKEAGMDLEWESVSTSTKITKKKVTFEVDFPVTIKQGTLSKKMDPFLVSIPSRLNTIYDFTNEFIHLEQKNPGAICVSCLIDLGFAKDLRTEKGPVKDQVIMFTIVDELGLINERSYRYSFLNKYKIGEER